MWHQREAEEKQYKEDMEKEFSSWFEVADKTEDTGVMRVVRRLRSPSSLMPDKISCPW